MSIEAYNFSFFCFSICIICSMMLLGGWTLGQRSMSRGKHFPFESGIDSYGTTNLRWVIKFYLLAVFFVIFDVEVLYLYTWVINIKDIGWCGFFEILVFVFTLFITLFYLLKENIFHFVSNKNVKKNYLIY